MPLGHQVVLKETRERLTEPLNGTMATVATMELPTGLAATGCILGLLLTGVFFIMLAPKTEDPKVINKYHWDFFEAKARREFDFRAEELINLGVAKVGGTSLSPRW